MWSHLAVEIRTSLYLKQEKRATNDDKSFFLVLIVQTCSCHHFIISREKRDFFFSFAKKLHHSRKKKTRLFFYRYCEIRQKLSTSAAILLLPPALFLFLFFFPRLLFSPYPPTPHSLRGEKEWVDGVNSETCPMHSRTPKIKRQKGGVDFYLLSWPNNWLLGTTFFFSLLFYFFFFYLPCNIIYISHHCFPPTISCPPHSPLFTGWAYNRQ